MTRVRVTDGPRSHPVLATLLALSILSVAPMLEPLSAAPGSGSCAPAGSNVTKIDNPGDEEVFTAPDGQVIDRVFIKAGQDCFEFTQDTAGPCYTVSGIGTQTVTVRRVGTGPGCRQISHIEVVTRPGLPGSTTTTTAPTTTTAAPTTTTTGKDTTTTTTGKESTTTTTAKPSTTTTTTKSTTTTTTKTTTTQKCVLGILCL